MRPGPSSLLLVFLTSLTLLGSADADVASTRHNLAISGPGTIKASSESQVCLFCHTPHNATPAAPLWNRKAPTVVYTPYTSSTARAGMAQPNGASLLCLSCHDGTIALGEVLNRTTPIAMMGAVTTLPAGAGRLGTDLGDDHPVSIAYSASLVSQRNNELAAPSGLTGKVKLDATGQMQCTSCHDAHDNTNGKFLVLPNLGSALCTTCHLKPGWAAGSHATSNKSWNGTTLANSACASCHVAHTAPGRKSLLSSATEEGVCLGCHNASVAAKNIQAELAKLSRHGVTASNDVHSPAEPEVVSAMHVECVDCHNPHAAKAGTGTVSGPLTGVRGVNISGAAVNPATAEYQVCFRCHADSTSRTPAPAIARQIAQGNIRLKFLGSNPSLHALSSAGTSTNVPSLLAPWTTASILKCSDCHNNNAGPGAGGTGPAGPHGSSIKPLLERQYVTTDNSAYAVGNYALCFKCHNSASIMADASFKEHNKHIDGENTPCSVCHDPHGVPPPGTSTSNSRLINFDTTVVKPSSGGILRFDAQGTNKGRCYLNCHGKNHNPLSY